MHSTENMERIILLQMKALKGPTHISDNRTDSDLLALYHLAVHLFDLFRNTLDPIHVWPIDCVDCYCPLLCVR